MILTIDFLKIHTSHGNDGLPLIMPSSTGGLVGAQHNDWTAVASTFWTCTHTTTGAGMLPGGDAGEKEEMPV